MDPNARPCGVVPCRSIAHRRRIEKYQVRRVAFADKASIPQADGRSRQAGHLVHGRWQVENSLFAAEVAKHPRKGTPQSRMRVRIMRQAITTHHHRGMRQHALHILQRHVVINRARRCSRFAASSWLTLQLPAIAASVFPGNFRMTLTPGNADLDPSSTLPQIEHAAAGCIGITIAMDSLRCAHTIQQRQYIGGAAPVVRPGTFQV